MNYFKKAGARNEEEQAMLQAIEAVIEAKQIPRNEIPDCLNLDDLIEVKHLVDAYEGISEQMDLDQTPEAEDNQVLETTIIDEELAAEDSQTFETSSGSEEETVHAEGVQDDAIVNDEPPISPQVEPEIDLAEIVQDDQFEFVSEDYDPFAEPIIERSYNKGTVANDSDNSEEAILSSDLEEAKEPTPLDNPEERTKKKAAEQTADTILKGYARLVPKPFKWLAKISESKVERLELSGQLDVSIEVSQGETFEDYVKSTNEQIDEIFEVDEDTLEEIREPLIEVLMEQQMELTPQQRLGMAVLSHLTQMFTVAMKLRSQNNRILAYQKELTRQMYTKVA